jgi:hypothetical protein
MSLWGRLVDTAKAVVRAVRDPKSFAPPPLPTTPPEPAPGRPGPRARPPAPRQAPRRVERVSRADLPRAWGPNKASLWADATMGEPAFARDWRAQAFYDAALFTHSEEREDREQNLANFKQYIWDEYGIDWDDVFDWEAYREAYDTTVGS